MTAGILRLTYDESELTFDQFKNNMLTLEKSLLVNHVDPIKDLMMATTWIDYFNSSGCDLIRKKHFLNDSIPRIARAVLKRIYSNNIEHHVTAKIFLCNIAKIIACNLSFINSELCELHILLTELFDHEQLFYKKYGFLKVISNSTTNHPPFLNQNKASKKLSKEEEKKLTFIKDLEVGSCIDVQNSSGIWELAEIVNFSEYHTEFEINLLSGSPDVTEWFCTERDAHRIAEYGSMTMSDSNLTSMNAINDENLDPSLVIDVDESIPNISNDFPTTNSNFNRYNLVPGSVLDAKDKSNIWYQACVTEIKYVDKPTCLLNDIDIDIDIYKGKESLVSIDFDDMVEELIEEKLKETNLANDEAVNNYDNILYSKNMRSASSVSSQDKSSILEVLVGVVDEIVDNNDLFIEGTKLTSSFSKENDVYDNMSTKLNIEGITHLGIDNNLNLIDPIILMDDNASVDSLVVESHDITPQTHINHIDYSDVFNNEAFINNNCNNKDFYVRISFLGWGEKYDEWINIDSEAKERLQEFNLFSSGNRGDGNIREEIISLIWDRVEDTNLLSNILPDSELSNNAILREHCFVSPYYVDVVNTFIEYNGFISLYKLLRGPLMINEIMTEKDINITSALNLIVAVGKTSQVLSKSLLINQYDDFLTLSSKRLTSLTHLELRQLPIELLESSLSAIEIFCKTYIGKNEEIKYIGVHAETLCLEMSLKLLSCPYLNKRLGGLKLLSDLIKKVKNYIDYPLGFFKTISFNSDNVELISYRNYPILRNIKLSDIFTRLINTHVLNDLFVGDQAHDSLIDRCTDVLSSLAKHGYLVKGLVDSIWEAAFEHRNQSSLKALVDVISCMDPSMLLSLLINANNIDNSSINIGIVDMIAAIGDRGLDILMTSDTNTNINMNLKLAMDLHSQAIKKLWSWADNSHKDINSSVVSRCIIKLESALSINIPFSQACKNNGLNYSWDIQWLRSYEVIEWTINAIDNGRSLDLAIKVLKSCIHSWPQIEDFSSNNTEVIIINDDGTEEITNVLSQPLDLPFMFPIKSYVVEYIEQKYNVLEVVTNTIVSVIQKDVQYKEEIERCFDFIHIFIRCSNRLVFKQEYIERIWNSITFFSKDNSIVMDALINFLYRMIMQSPCKVSNVSMSDETVPTIEEKRSSYCSSESVKWIFDVILCDVNSFIKSPYYSLSALNCTEKYFRWLNLSGGFLLNVKKAGSLTFVLIDTPSSLIGLNVFSEIILSCISDQVANQTVKFLTSLPSKLSTKLVKQGELINFNNILLDQCIQNLHLVNKKLINVTNNVSIKRLFMLLGGLINETSNSNKSLSPFRPHGNLTKGKGININVSYFGKVYNTSNGLISVFENDILEDVVKQIAKKIFKSSNSIKVFSKGKEISITGAKKSLLQLCIKDSDTFMVAFNKTVDKTESSLETSKIDTDNTCDMKFDDKHIDTDTHTNSVSTENLSLDIEFNNYMNDQAIDFTWKELPSIVLSHNFEYFTLLTQLLDNVHGIDCDVIWALINSLPTSPYLLCLWMNLDFTDIRDIFNGDSTLSSVFYSLQIIEFLLEPLSSINNLNNMNIDNLTSNVEFDWINHLNLLNSDKKYNTNNTFSISKLLHWPLEFINKNGLLYLELIMKWLTKQLDKYLVSIDTSVELNGVTSQLLLNSMQLCSKIMRSFFIFNTYYKYPNTIKEVLSVSVADRDTDTSTVAITTTAASSTVAAASTTVNATTAMDESSVTYGPQLPSHYKSTESIQIDNIEIDTSSVVKEIICDEATLISKEWGKQLQAHSDILLCGINYSWTQKNILMLMSSLRKFCNYNFFVNDINYDNNGYDSNLKSIGYQSLQELIINVLNNLLVVWNCIVIIKPNSLSFLKSNSNDSLSNNMDSYINLEEFLNFFLIGTYKYDKDKSDNENNKLKQFNDTIGKWTIKAINNVLSLASLALDINSNDEINEESKEETNMDQLNVRLSPLDSIKENLVLSLLSMRPSLLSDNNNSFSFSANYNPVFTIMNKIIKDSCLNLLRVEISLQVFLETKVFLGQIKQEISLQKLPPQKICFLDGNINLLIALSSGYESVLQSLYENDIVDFLLVDCLGLEDDNTESVLFIDNKCKERCYKLLNILSEWNNDVANDIINRVTKLHNSLKLSTSFLYKPDQLSRSNTSYVGIRNMGSTCYMNCLLQILFMNPLIKESILETPVNTKLCQEDFNNNIIIQLKKMFCYLKFSNKKYFVPTDWVYCFKDQDGILPINVMLQQDANEFLLSLCDRLEEPLSATSIVSSQSNSSNNDENIVQNNNRSVMDMSFGGKISNQMILGLDSQQNSYSDIREQEEKFYCITLNVKGCKGLEDSLSKYIEGEQINDFNWNEGLPKVTITKRYCFTNLSDTLIFHLKRFDFNFDTFLREKVNDSFPFPMKLNMLPYTREGIYNKNIKANCYYEYELAGIVVHTGTTNSGHYYSYIKDDTSKKWFEFNDSEITELNECNISKECFGGMTSTHDYNLTTNTVFTNDIPNPKSAFMLVYRRVESEYNVDSIIEKIKTSNISLNNNYNNDILIETKNKIIEDNKSHDFELKIYSSTHITFVQTLMDNLSMKLAKSNKLMNQNILHQFTNFYLRIVARSSFVSLYSKFADFLSICMDTRIVQYKLLNDCDCDVDHVELLDTSDINIHDAYDEDEAAAIAYSLMLTGKSNKTENSSNNTDEDISSDTSSSMIESNIKVDDTMVDIKLEDTNIQGVIPNGVNNLARNNDEGYLDVASLIMSKSINNDFDNIFELLYSSDATIRMATAKIIFKTYKTLCTSQDIYKKSLLCCFDEFGINNDLLGNNSLNSINKIDEDIYTDNSSLTFQNKNKSTIGSLSDLNESGINTNNKRYADFDLSKKSSDWTDNDNLYSDKSKHNQNISDLDGNEDEELAKAIRLSKQDMVKNESCANAAVEAVPISPQSDFPHLDDDDDDDDDDRPGLLIPITDDNRFLSPLQNPESIYSDLLSSSSNPSSKLHNSNSNLCMLSDITASSIRTTNNDLNLSTNLSPACYFLYLITKDKNMRQIAENWRKSDAHVWLLLQICQISEQPDQLYNQSASMHKDFLIKREIIGQLIDIYLGEQSPLTNIIYTKGTRKVTPSSYISVGPCLKNGELPAVGKNIPNFVDLLNVVSILINRYKEQLIMNNDNYNSISDYKLKSTIQLSKVDMLAIESRTFYSTLLLQHRYHQSTRDIFIALCRGNYNVSETIMEVLFEAIVMAANDCTYHIFYVLEGVLAIEDNYSTTRSLKIFNATGGLFDTLFSIKDTAMKNKNVCICIRAILTLSTKNKFVLEAIKPKLNIWAPWILKFSYQLMNKFIQEHETLSALYASNKSSLSSNVSSNSSTASYFDALNTNVSTNIIEKGPYLLIYGENDDERELTWKDRSERTFQFLHACIINMGGNPDHLLPEDSFVIDEPIPLLEDIPNRQTVSTNTSIGPFSNSSNMSVYNNSSLDNNFLGADLRGGGATVTPLLEFRDGMTDEELASFLAQSSELD